MAIREWCDVSIEGVEALAKSAVLSFEGEYTCRPEDMVVAEYEDPDGELSWCANTEVANLRVTVWKRQGPLGRWREHARLIAPKSGRFEVGGRERDAAVGKDHTTAHVAPVGRRCGSADCRRPSGEIS